MDPSHEERPGRAEPGSPSGRVRALFVLVLVLSLGARLAFVARTAPYPLHKDEGHLTRAAARILRDGDPNPRFFRYPSLPIYLVTGSFLVGASLDGEGLGDVGVVQRPYYERPTVVLAARVAFALLSVVAMGLAADAARRAFDEPALLVLVPLGLALSDRFLLQSWSYLNVDVVGACVCAAAVWWLFATRERDGTLARAVVPGLLTGLAVGSKYYLGLVGLPFALALLRRDRRDRRVRHGTTIVLATLAGFLVSTPYALLDASAFAEGVTTELEHYAEGHEGGEGEPGLPQLAYYAGQLEEELGLAVLVLAALGLGVALRTRREQAWLYVAFPAALLAFLCTQRVHFPRNLMSFHLFVPGLAGLGLLLVWRRLTSAAAVARWGPAVRPAAAVALALLAVPFVPLERVRASYAVPVDSRNAAADWIAVHAEPGRRVWVAEELQMDVRPLVGFDVRVAPSVQFVVPGMRRVHGEADPLFVLPRLEEGTRFEETYGPALGPVRALDELARFGSNAVPRIRTKLIHMGNPRLAVHALGDGS